MDLLAGIRVVELASDRAAYAGKVLGDLGADVVVVEPPGGHVAHAYGPFVDDVADPERCLTWWNYNTSKRGIVLDLDAGADRTAFKQLIADADIVLEGEDPGTLEAKGLGQEEIRGRHPALDLGDGHAVRFARRQRTHADDRPHDARRRRVRLELRLRRSLDRAGATERKPRATHCERLRGTRRADRGAAPRRHRVGAARRREHARGTQRQHRGELGRLALDPEHRAAADRSPHGTGTHHGDADPRRRRALRHHGHGAHQRQDVPRRARMAARPRARGRVPRVVLPPDGHRPRRHRHARPRS